MPQWILEDLRSMWWIWSDPVWGADVATKSVAVDMKYPGNMFFLGDVICGENL